MAGFRTLAVQALALLEAVVSLMFSVQGVGDTQTSQSSALR